MTVRDLINSAFKFIHVLGAGESLTSDETDEALPMLNGIIEQANIDKLLGYYKSEVVFPFVANQTVYTIGPASTTPHVTAPRPVEILSAFTRRGGVDLPTAISNKQDYDNVQVKGAGTNGWSQILYYEPTWPKGTLTFYMKPLDALTEAHITVMAEIAAFATLDDVVSMPPVYSTWLKYKLGQRLSPEYGMEFTDTMKELLIDVEASLKRNNIKAMPVAGTGLASLSASNNGKYNVYSDQTNR